jgi:2-polyprenyl-3-methyl-5-hydroxy-6-metoxy-1,4-benzoquinol methylase
MLRFLKRLVGSDRGSADEDEFSWMHPPEDPGSATGWDCYWDAHLAHQALGFADIFCEDDALARVMDRNGLRRILCAGCGVSMEPLALAAAGFEVRAVDISSHAIAIMQHVQQPDRGRLLMHFSLGDRSGADGSIQWEVGDLFDPAVCPGPYDVILERRTVQVYDDSRRDTLLAALANRLSADGIFFSQCHNGAWRPPALPVHRNEAWFRDRKWHVWNGESKNKPAGQVAWLQITTG